jgi:hypothetical protein
MCGYWLSLACRVLSQERGQTGPKVYSLHASGRGRMSWQTQGAQAVRVRRQKKIEVPSSFGSVRTVRPSSGKASSCSVKPAARPCG